MKNVYLIGGTMGVGKTTACQMLKRRLENAVFLDGDWCWDADPFWVTEETKEMALDNICHLLNNFIRCSIYQNIIFCWVMHEQAIISSILARLELRNCTVKTVSLVCREEALAQRLEKDIGAGTRQAGDVQRSVERLPLYDGLDTIKIDVSDLTAAETAEKLAAL